MKKISTYLEPQAYRNEIAPEGIVCDSYGSGIENFKYEDLNCVIKP